MEKWYRKALERRSFGNLVDEAAHHWPTKTFYVSEDARRISFSQFKEMTDYFAKGLLKLGVRKGDRVGIWMTNRPEWMVAEYAVYKIGAILVPIYTYFKQDEVEYALRESGVSNLIMSNSFLKGKIDALQILANLCPAVSEVEVEDFRCKRLPDLRRVIVLNGEHITGCYDYNQILDAGSSSKLDHELSKAQFAVDPFDVMKIQFTSGTTGFPKGGMHRHIVNLCCWSACYERIGLNNTSLVLQNMPIFTNWGTWVTASTLMTGATLVDTGEFHTNPELSLRVIEQEKATWLSATTAQLLDLFTHPNFHKYDLSSLKDVWFVGALQREVKEVLLRHKVEPMSGWGMSEAGGLGSCTLRTDPFEVRTETIGLPLQCVRLKVVDSATGKRIIDKPGELLIRDVYPGSAGFTGYWNMPEESQRLLTPDGWFRTGDLAVEGEDGYFRFAGREKEMLRVGGFNVYPNEIERVLKKHPDIKEVVVIGVPDKRLEEVPMAWVLTHEGAKLSSDEVIAFAKENLSSYAIPKYIRFYKAGELPVSSTAKIQKQVIADISCKELGLKR